jgi:hypothetical protein
MGNLLAEPAEILLARLQGLAGTGREGGTEEIAVHNLGQPAAEFAIAAAIMAAGTLVLMRVRAS